MRLGMQPANSGPQATPEAMTALAELADDLGFDSLQVTDHTVIPVNYGSAYPYSSSGRMAAGPDTAYFEPLSLIAYLGAKTRRIRLGTSVLVAPYRNPVITAKQLACIDVLTGGRLVIGLGVGWMEEEFRAVDARPFADRGAITDEIIQVYRAIWRDQPASFQGTHYTLEPVGALPKPLQPGGIPIIIGGHTKPAIRRAARLGDGWQPLKLSPDDLAAAIAYLHEQAKVNDRDLDGFAISLRLSLRLTSGPTTRRPEEQGSGILVGRPDEVAEQLAVYAKLGVTEAVFDFRTCTAEETRETLLLAGAALVGKV